MGKTVVEPLTLSFPWGPKSAGAFVVDAAGVTYEVGADTGVCGAVTAAVVGTGVAALVFFALSVQPATDIAPTSRMTRLSVTKRLEGVRLFMMFNREIIRGEYTLFRQRI
jgi:hypothetical protein